MPVQAWVTLAAGVIGFAGVIASLVQRTHADKRAEWWRRATWAVDHTLSDDVDAQIVGFDVLGKLQAARLATRASRRLFAEWITPQMFDDDPSAQMTDTGSEEV